MFPRSLTDALWSARIDRVLPESGPVAQLGARFHGMEEVIGSIPIRSTNNSFRDIGLRHRHFFGGSSEGAEVFAPPAAASIP
jgi:hypothetical protein